MHPSTPTPAATGITILPEATRDEQLARHGLPDRPAVELRPGWSGLELGEGHTPHQGGASRTGYDPATLEFLWAGGWSIETPGAHRGTLHPDEYVDRIELRVLVERELGLTFDEIQSVYRQGPLSAEARALRNRIDIRLLEISQLGGNMLELGRILGWGVEKADATGGARCKTMERAIDRARTSGTEASS